MATDTQLAPLSLSPPQAVMTPMPESISTSNHGLIGPEMSFETRAELSERSDYWARQLMSHDPFSIDFKNIIDDVEKVGVELIQESSKSTNRLLQNPESSLKDRGGDDTPVALSLTELRVAIDNLGPSKKNMRKKFLGLIPFGMSLTVYFRRFETQQSHLDAIVEQLNTSRDELRKDNTVLKVEQMKQWTTLGQLIEQLTLIEFLDQAVEKRVLELDSSDPEVSDQVRERGLFYIRQKHQDLLNHIAVMVQGYLAVDMIINNNNELAKGIQRSTTTTISALRTAVMTAQSLNNQKLVISQVGAINSTTSELIERTAEMNKTNSIKIHQQAMNTSISLESLKKALSTTRETVDTVNEYRREASEAMGATITSLQEELSKTHQHMQEVGSPQ